jgi:hypothetical protein
MGKLRAEAEARGGGLKTKAGIDASENEGGFWSSAEAGTEESSGAKIESSEQSSSSSRALEARPLSRNWAQQQNNMYVLLDWS